ncbi:MAG: C4-dicarboxylate-binding protein DctP, partial [Reinekea sp.]
MRPLFWEEKHMMNWTKRSLMGAAIATMTALPVVAQETVSAVVIDGYPDRALWVKEFTNFFIPEVDRRLAETGNYV